MHDVGGLLMPYIILTAFGFNETLPFIISLVFALIMLVISFYLPTETKGKDINWKIAF